MRARASFKPVFHASLISTLGSEDLCDSMLPLAWKSLSSVDSNREYLALLSYLPLKSYLTIPKFLCFTFQTQRQLNGARGLIGYSLQAQLLRRRFWTLSVWQDESALMEFVKNRPHSEIMDALAPHMKITHFTRWRVSGSELPLKWGEAKRRMPQKSVV